MNDAFKKLDDLIQSLKPIVDSFSEDQAGNEEHFRKCAKAAFIKSYELCLAASKEDSSKDFFILSALRGICEDYIVLRFLDQEYPKEKDEIILLKIREQSLESSIAQWNFFSDHHPEQFLYYKDVFKTDLDEVKSLLQKAMAGHLQKKNSTMPSVFYMAEKINSSHLYKYFYHATSSLVHFNPRMLLRMGWGDLPAIKFSVTNFAVYYQHFCKFYSAYLFKELAFLIIENKWLKEIKPEIEKISKSLDEVHRWPELVTFEEMNIGALSRHLLYQSPASKKRIEKIK